MKPCTCTGFCKGAEGLGEGWQCVFNMPLPPLPPDQIKLAEGILKDNEVIVVDRNSAVKMTLNPTETGK